LSSIIDQDFCFDSKISKDVLISVDLQEDLVNVFMNELEGLKKLQKLK